MTDGAPRSTPRLLMESFVRQTTERLRTASLLGHPGETGRAREEALRDHLRAFLPPALGVSTGFVIDAKGGRSRQIDIIIHMSDYHAVFMVNGIPLVPVEAVIAVFEIKSSAHSTSVLRDCYDVLKSVKELDRSNGGRNYGLVDREKQLLSPEHWERFDHQVFGAVISVESCSRRLWLDATREWCALNDRRVWPNFYCGVNDYIGAYHVSRDGQLVLNTNHTMDAHALIAFSPPESPLAWATHEVLNFVRVAKRIDYSPTSYLSGEGETVDTIEAIELP